MEAVPILREQLVDRRQRLQAARPTFEEAREFERLLQEVDAALARMDAGAYGLCESCHEPIEPDRLIADPLVRFCLDHLTPPEQRALEEDLQLAARIQRELLPEVNQRQQGWEIAYRYQPAGAVSGDYCDVIDTSDGTFYFMVGDVSGKGIAASMLMSHLHAMFRALTSVGLPLDTLFEQANRIFCESTLPTHYATLACGRATRSGDVTICNAGHPPAFVVHDGRVTAVEATGLPLGMFCTEQFRTKQMRLEPGDTILLYTDGLFESENAAGASYGLDRLTRTVAATAALQAEGLLTACLKDLQAFRAGARGTDDLTLMAVQRAANATQ